MMTLQKPIALAVNVPGIPTAIIALPNWVVWRYVLRNGKWTKAPIDCKTGNWASSTDNSTWASFEPALTYHHSHPDTTDGMGYVLSADDPFTAVDLDHCRAGDGEIEPWARDVIEALWSYSEVSPSGSGIRILCCGALPPQGRRKGKIELYDTDRYITLTGCHLDGSPTTIEDRQDELIALHTRIFGEAKRKPKPRRSVHPSTNGYTLTDADLIEKACAARNGLKFRRLWEGDTAGYASASEADLALANEISFWTGPDSEDRIVALLRQSGLAREKFDRDEYAYRTAAKALEGRTEFYQPAIPRARPTFSTNGSANLNGVVQKSLANVHRTDLGNGKRFVADHGNDFRYCHSWGKALIWDGRRFKPDETGESERRAKQTILRLYHWASDQIRELGERLHGASEEQGKERIRQEITEVNRLLAHALKSESARALSAMVALAGSEPGVPVVPKELDRDPWLLNVQNGTIDLRTGELRPHAREDLLTKLLPIDYDPSARCSLWLKFLNRSMNHNQDLIDFLHRVAGYCLTGSTAEQCLFFLHGEGANGKSVFLLTLLELLGDDYAMQAPAELLMIKQGERHPTELADLHGKRVVVAIEVEEGRRMAEGLVKQLTGGDRIRARRMRENFWEFQPSHKILLAGNHKPVIRNQDYAIWRRIFLIPFSVVIPEDQRDKDLVQKLKGELPGILGWAVKGCLNWQRHGLGVPDEVRKATTEYREEQDTLGNFLQETCFLGPEYRIGTTKLYEAYCEWLKPQAAPSRNLFADHLKAKGYDRRRSGSTGGVEWHGLRLRNS